MSISFYNPVQSLDAPHLRQSGYSLYPSVWSWMPSCGQSCCSHLLLRQKHLQYCWAKSVETKIEKWLQNCALSKASTENEEQGSLQLPTQVLSLLGTRDDIYPVAGRVSFLVFVPQFCSFQQYFLVLLWGSQTGMVCGKPLGIPCTDFHPHPSQKICLGWTVI